MGLDGLVMTFLLVVFCLAAVALACWALFEEAERHRRPRPTTRDRRHQAVPPPPSLRGW